MRPIATDNPISWCVRVKTLMDPEQIILDGSSNLPTARGMGAGQNFAYCIGTLLPIDSAFAKLLWLLDRPRYVMWETSISLISVLWNFTNSLNLSHTVVR